MSSEATDRVELLQGTLDLIVLRALATMGPQHAYGLAARLEQVGDHPLMLNQGTLYPALVRLEQKGWIKGTWQKTDSNRDAKYYAITKAGTRALEKADRALAEAVGPRQQAAARRVHPDVARATRAAAAVQRLPLQARRSRTLRGRSRAPRAARRRVRAAA